MIIVQTTYPDKRSADDAAAALVQRGLAACVSVIRIENSIYRWEGRVERHPEFLLLIKTAKKAYGRVEQHIRENHPHRVPEIIYIDVAHGQRDYLNWVESGVRALRDPAAPSANRRAGEPSNDSSRAKKPRTFPW